MSGAATPDWGAVYGAPKKKEAQPAQFSPPPESRPSSGPDWGRVYGQSASSQPAEIEAPEEHPGWFGYVTQSVLKSVFHKGLSDTYDKIVSNFNEYLPEQKPGYWSKVAEGVGRGAPELVDMVSSPAGALLLAGHLFPATLPIATAIDGLLGFYQIGRTIPSVIEAVNDPHDPDKVSSAIKDMALSFGAFKTTRGILGKPEWKGKLDRPIDAQKTIDLLVKADPDQKLGIINDLIKTSTLKEKTRAKLYQIPLLRTAASILDVRKPPLLEAASYLVDQRDIAIKLGEIEAGQMRAQFKKEVPEAEQHVTKMGYVMENSATPDEVGLSASGRKWIEKTREWNRQADKQLQAAYPGIKLHDPETYIMHAWGFDNEGEMTAKSPRLAYGRRMMRDPQLQRRTVGTYREGIEENGWKPAVDNVADLLYKRHMIAVTAIANQKMMNAIYDMGSAVAEDEVRTVKDPVTGKRSASPYASWPSMISRPLERAVYVGKTPKDQPIFQKRPVRVHPDIHMALEAVMGESFPLRDPASGRMTVAGALETIRSFGKQNAVSMSLFHNYAISEQAQGIALGNAGYELNPDLSPKPLGPLAKAGKFAQGVAKATFVSNPDYYRGLKSGLFEVIHHPDKASLPPILGVKFNQARGWVEAGGSFGSADAETASVEQMRNFKIDPENHPKMAPIINNTIGRGLHFVGGLNYIMNRGLWDYYLPSNWINSAEMIFTKEMNLKPGRTEPEIKALKMEIAKHVNKAFGTETTSSMLMSPKARFIANFFLFAPVWTFSNFRILSNGFQTETSHRLTGRWMGGAAFAWFATTTLANYATTGWVYSGKDGPVADKNGVHRAHGPWDNPGAPLNIFGKKTTGLTENWHYIFTGYNPDGSESYIHFGKGYSEPLAALDNPLMFITGKMALPTKTAVAMLTKHEPGSGYEVIDRNLSTRDQMVQYAIAFSENFLPLTLQDAARWAERKGFPELVPETGSTQATIYGFPLGLPTRKGLNLSRAVDIYQDIVEDHSINEAVREALIEQTFKSAEANHIPTASIAKGYRERVKKKQKVAAGPRFKYDVRGNIQEPPEIRQ